MGRLIVLADDVAGNTEIREMLEAYGYTVEPLQVSDGMSALKDSQAAAIMFGVHDDLGTAAAGYATELRENGYKNLIVATGVPVPEVATRQHLAELSVWYVPALSGSGDVVARIRQLLP